MAISLRLDRTLEHDLAKLVKAEGVSKSTLVRSLIVEYVARKQGCPSPWELGKDVFGRAGSGRRDLSTNRKAVLREKLRAKHNRG